MSDDASDLAFTLVTLARSHDATELADSVAALSPLDMSLVVFRLLSMVEGLMQVYCEKQGLSVDEFYANWALIVARGRR